MQFSKKDILDMDVLSAAEIHLILDTAENMKEISLRPIKKVPTLRGKTVVLYFSTPQHLGKAFFETAAKRLSADCIDLGCLQSPRHGSERLMESIGAISAMNPDVLVMARPYAGGANLLAKHCRFSIINAGDGCHGHPAQTLLDMLAVREIKGDIRGLKVSIIGDICRNPVARSHCSGFSKLGADVLVSAPAAMVPKGIEELGISICTDPQKSITEADVVILLKDVAGMAAHDTNHLLKEFFHQVDETRRRLKHEQAHPLFITRDSACPGNSAIRLHEAGTYYELPMPSGAVIAVHMAQLYLVAGGIRSAVTH